MTNDKKQPGLPVVEVDQAFPLMTTDGVSRSTASTGGAGDQGPTVSAAIRDVLGWRPRVQDTKAFTAALAASFELSTVEDHVIARYVPRGVAVQADLGGVTGGQASLYLRAKAAHEQITRMLDSLQPLRTDADPQDCEAYRGLVRDSVRRIVLELGREGGPRVPLVDSAFSVLTGFQPTPAAQPPVRPAKNSTRAVRGRLSVVTPLAAAEIDPDSVPGQLGALRDRFGLDDDHVNTVDEEKQRTSFWTLVELITDLQRSWNTRRSDFTLANGSGFLGTDLVQISRLLAAAAEQIDEFEAVLDSVLVSGAERQTIMLDRTTGLTLDDLVQWLRVFVTEDGPAIIRDTGRDGLVSSFTPTSIALLHTLRDKLVRRVVPCGGPSCGGGCHCGSRGQVTCIPLGCCTPLPPGMYAGRVKIAVSTLCGLVERLTAKAIRIGRFAGVVLLDLSAVPFDDEAAAGADFIRIEVRGLHLRPTYLPAFIAGPADPDPGELILPLQGSATADPDQVSGVFHRSALPATLQTLLDGAGDRGVLMAANEVPVTVVDGELGAVIQSPAVTTWPRLQPAGVVASDPTGPFTWTDIPGNQRFVPQSPLDPLESEITDDCLDDCDGDCEDGECDCHPLKAARDGLDRVSRIISDTQVRDRASTIDLPNEIAEIIRAVARSLQDRKVVDLMDAVTDADRRVAGDRAAEERAARSDARSAATARAAEEQLAAARAEVRRARAVRDRTSGTSVVMPAPDESTTAGVVTRSPRAAGETVTAGEPLMEVTTDVGDTEVLAPASGVLRSVAEEGATVEVDEELAVIGPIDETEPEAAGYETAGSEAAEQEDGAPAVAARSEPEVSALDRLRDLVAEQKGALATRVRGIQDRPEIRRFVVEALRATEKDQ